MEVDNKIKDFIADYTSDGFTNQKEIEKCIIKHFGDMDESAVLLFANTIYTNIVLYNEVLMLTKKENSCDGNCHMCADSSAPTVH